MSLQTEITKCPAVFLERTFFLFFSCLEFEFSMLKQFIVLLVVLVACCHAHFVDPRIRSFQITTEEQNSRTVRTVVDGSEASCTFSFRTSVSAVTEQPLKSQASSAASVDLASVVKRLEGLCASKTFDYWTYELCFGKMFRQYHSPDQYNLGTFEHNTITGTTQKLLDGTPCEGLNAHPPRTTKVMYSCMKSAKTPQLISVDEVSTCNYQANVGLDAFCADPKYPVVNAAAVASSSGEQKDLVNEDWMLQITHTDDNRLVCTVASHELRSMGSKLHFVEFQLRLNTQGVRISSSSSNEEKAVARHPGRQPFGSNELRLVTGGVRNGDAFDGKLAYVRIST